MTGAVRGFLFPASAKPPQPAGASPAGASPDINYRLAVSPKAAAEGTTISINYLRDGSQNHRLTVTIPPGIKDQGLLRLSGQGHLGPNQKRGDLLLTVLIIS
ncbi:MAG: hypothetical protein LBK52_04235 [Deltaproteobacteria bacterium]|nr:hypothetical protein [Deltaproteobacteria bacterium]